MIQDCLDKIQTVATGNDEMDMAAYLDLVADHLKLMGENIAPNNPFDNNIIAPIVQVARNKTWYDEELVPSRLQDLPVNEQYDEKTDKFSVGLSNTLNELTDGKVKFSPYKMNYLLNQYSGGLGDIILPMITPKAESGDDSKIGQIL